MEGLFVSREEGENVKLHLLRFYANGYVIYKFLSGDQKDYVTKELKRFSMTGMDVNGEPESTFCGAHEAYDDIVSFKVENELRDPSNTWAQKDVLSFRGEVKEEKELRLTRTSKRTKLEVEQVYVKTTDQALLASLTA